MEFAHKITSWLQKNYKIFVTVLVGLALFGSALLVDGGYGILDLICYVALGTLIVLGLWTNLFGKKPVAIFLTILFLSSLLIRYIFSYINFFFWSDWDTHGFINTIYLFEIFRDFVLMGYAVVLLFAILMDKPVLRGVATILMLVLLFFAFIYWFLVFLSVCGVRDSSGIRYNWSMIFRDPLFIMAAVPTIHAVFTQLDRFVTFKVDGEAKPEEEKPYLETKEAEVEEPKEEDIPEAFDEPAIEPEPEVEAEAPIEPETVSEE